MTPTLNSRRPSVALSTALGAGGISILHLRGAAPPAPVAENEIKHHWWRDDKKQIIDETLITKFGADYLVTGHGGSACALALLADCEKRGFIAEIDGENFFGKWGELFARCRTEAQVAAVAEAYAASEENGANEGKIAVLNEFLRPRKICLLGAPNVGKSSLFNQLLGGDHALVSEIPGATRDAVSRNLAIGGYFVELSDLAGLREKSASAENLAPLEQTAITRALQKIADADLLIFVAGADDLANRAAQKILLATPFAAPLIIAENQFSDNQSSAPIIDNTEKFAAAPRVKISAISGAGIDDLLALIAENLASPRR
jgi:small GTP-binding protein